MDLALETHGLSKTYRSGVRAVIDLDLSVKFGEVYGFLGLNGAGKTTTLRMLLGLVRPTAGTALVLGESPGTRAALTRIGSMVESPAFYPHLSGAENLRLLARYGGVSAGVDAALAQAGLADDAGRRAGTYSMGMRQRLGIAAALLRNPDLLILDEPTNSLDPVGMASMRALIRSLADAGRTVLFSSHLLAEVEQIADRVGIIRGGALVAVGTLAQLQARAGGGGVTIRAHPTQAALHCLAGVAGAHATRGEGGAILVDIDPDRSGEINRELVLAGVTVTELRPTRPSLEGVFLQLGQPAGDSEPVEVAA